MLSSRSPQAMPLKKPPPPIDLELGTLVADVTQLIEAGRTAAVRSVNAVMTATYWRIGQLIVEREQHGARRAEYGAAILERLAAKLTARFGRGFSRRNLDTMRRFYLGWPIRQTASAKSIRQTVSAKSEAPILPLPWSHYVRLLAVANHSARASTNRRPSEVDGPPGS